jgi:hypothetical protein
VRPNDPSLTPPELTGSRNFRLADLVTIMNGFCGSFSLFSSANYLLTSDDYYLRNALLFPLAGLIFDFFDGKVARWRKSSSMLGQELDSLADLVCPLACSPHPHSMIPLVTDIIWSCACGSGLRRWPSHDPRHGRPHVLHLLRPSTPR